MTGITGEILAARAGGKVERAHTVPHLGSYNVAAHSWGVAMLMLQLFPEHFSKLAPYCLVHDVPEAWVGDVPANTKRYAPGMKQGMDKLESRILARLRLPDEADLEPDQRSVLKACDHLELYLWSLEQVALGNQNARSILTELDNFFAERPLPEKADALYRVISRPDFNVVPRHAGFIKEIIDDGE